MYGLELWWLECALGYVCVLFQFLGCDVGLLFLSFAFYSGVWFGRGVSYTLYCCGILG